MSRPAKPDRADASVEVGEELLRHVTLHDVGGVAGLSAMTVWRALNTPDKVPAATLSRVREAAAQTGYVPNLVAGGLRSRKSRLVAALVPTVAGTVFLETIEALTRELAARGYQLMLGQIGYHETREDALIDALLGRRPDGVVLTGTLHSAQSRRRLQRARIPVVETWDLTDDPVDMVVGFSQEEVGRAVCRYLAERGRRHLAVIGGDDERALRRLQGLEAEAMLLGLAPPLRSLMAAPTTVRQGRSSLQRLLEAHPEVDAVFCTSDLLALGVLTQAAYQGIDVPRRLAVIGFGDMPFAADLEPSLTSVRIDGPRIAELTAGFLADASEGRDVGEKIVDVGFKIVERSSA